MSDFEGVFHNYTNVCIWFFIWKLTSSETMRYLIWFHQTKVQVFPQTKTYPRPLRVGCTHTRNLLNLLPYQTRSWTRDDCQTWLQRHIQSIHSTVGRYTEDNSKLYNQILHFYGFIKVWPSLGMIHKARVCHAWVSKM